MINYAEISNMPTSLVFDCLKTYGQMLDTELATQTRLPLYDVHTALATLADQGEIARCQVIRYVDGVAMAGVQCRLVGHSAFFGPAYGHGSRFLAGRSSSGAAL